MLQKAGITDSNGQWNWAAEVKEGAKKADTITKGVVTAFATVADWAFQSVAWIGENLQQGYASISGCGTIDAGTAGLVNVVMGFVRRWFADLPEMSTQVWDTYMRWACPVELPSAADADECWRRGLISDDTWNCWVRSNGVNVEEHQFVRDSALEWPTFQEVNQLLNRGVISDDQYTKYLERAGVQDSDQLHALNLTQDWVPTPSDAIEWMLKDVADPNVTVTFGLGAEFNQKYAGPSKAAFDANQVSVENASNIWEAHWRNMSPGALYNMLHRLRPGWTASMSDADCQSLALQIAPRRPVGYTPPTVPEGYPGPVPVYYFLDDLQDGDVTGRQFLDNLTTGGFQVYEALGQADYPPFWRERLMAVSYNVLTRVDMRRAFETGNIDQATLIILLQDRGYTATDAKRLAAFFNTAQIQLTTRRPAANEWVKTGFDTGLLKTALMDTGMRADQWEQVLGILTVRRNIFTQNECLTKGKKQYVAGNTTRQQAIDYVMSIGIDGTQAAQIVTEWTCVKGARPRQVTAAEVCKQYCQGIIQTGDAITTIINLGYTKVQAKRMLASCVVSNLQKKGGKCAGNIGQINAS